MFLTRVTKFFLHEMAPSEGSSPACDLLETWIELETTVHGSPDAQTGYILDISQIDRAVFETVAPMLAASSAQHRSIFHTLPTAANALAHSLESEKHIRLHSIALDLSPTKRIQCLLTETRPHSPLCTPMPQPTIEITASYEFAASHRLHCADRSDEENRRIFGKCNNPNGHGHNYRIEVRCAVPMGSTGAFDAVDAAVENEIMRRFDHRHLNLDCPEFAKLNPSVENIAKICFEYLEAALANAGLQARCVRVHETPKTSAIYPATQF